MSIRGQRKRQRKYDGQMQRTDNNYRHLNPRRDAAAYRIFPFEH